MPTIPSALAVPKRGVRRGAAGGFPVDVSEAAQTRAEAVKLGARGKFLSGFGRDITEFAAIVEGRVLAKQKQQDALQVSQRTVDFITQTEIDFADRKSGATDTDFNITEGFVSDIETRLDAALEGLSTNAQANLRLKLDPFIIRFHTDAAKFEDDTLKRVSQAQFDEALDVSKRSVSASPGFENLSLNIELT